MPYDHKKSLRTLTDEQFSDGTTIDGTRIDDALGESVEHFNAVPHGNLSTRFTKTQYIFGHQPAGYTGTPNSAISPPLPVLETVQGSVEGPTWPWNFITNNRNTSAAVSSAPPLYGNPSTPAAGFQNKWRFKGTNFDQFIVTPGGSSGIQELENDGRWAEVAWEADWAAGVGAGVAAQRHAASSYQFAWAHGWIFEKPVIVDSLCVLLRTDRPMVVGGGGSRGYYDAPFSFLDFNTVEHETQGVTIQMSVDNEFAKEDRSLNDIELAFNNRRLGAYTVTDVPLSLDPYIDMLPNSPEYAGGNGDGLNGRLVRFRGLNLPIRQGARLRLALVIPWFKNNVSATPLLDQQGLNTGNIADKFADWDNSPTGDEPMWGFAVDGNLTVLEQVTS